MKIDEVIELVQGLVFAKTNKRMEQAQINVLQGAWENQTYEQIAETYCLSSTNAKAVGARLWGLLSRIFETKVNKKNMRLVVERKLGDGESFIPSLDIKQRITSQSYFPSLLPTPEIPGGQVPLNSLFYVERPPIEANCYIAIQQAGTLTRIHASAQMGKTSLVSRILHEGKRKTYHTLNLSLQLACQEIFSNLERFLQWFCASVAKSLKLSHQINEFWDPILGSSSNTTNYFENYLLPQIDRPLLICLDDLEVVFQYSEIASDFLQLLRNWCEKAKDEDYQNRIWQKLRLVIAYSTEVYLPLDLNQALFNDGLSVELPEFTKGQIQDLAWRYGLEWDLHQVEKLMSLVGGYPYLVRKALHHIWSQDFTLEQLLPSSNLRRRFYGEHLRRKFGYLQQHPALLSAFSQVVSAPTSIELNWIQTLQLYSLGLVHLRGNKVVPSCELYRQYFGS